MRRCWRWNARKARDERKGELFTDDGGGAERDGG